jgi:neutral ceramidase
MSGRRWKAAIKKAAVDTKLLSTNGTSSSAEPIVLLGGPANTYTHYITTEEEYKVQRYEGASTLYGPHTLNAYINLTVTSLKYLTDSSPSIAAVAAGPQPQINSAKSLSLIPGIPTDNPPASKKFGDVLKAPAAQYKRGDTAVATFVAASPRNNFRLESTFAAVQFSSSPSNSTASLLARSQARHDAHFAYTPDTTARLQTRDEQWQTVRSDDDWELVFRWRRTGKAATPSEAEISWEIGADAAPGTYRILYNGDARDARGQITPFQGVSPAFVVV